jgi:hypothetical protein
MTDRTDFESMLERRLRAYADTVARPVSAVEVARSTMAAAASPVGRASALAGPRRPLLLVGLAAALLLVALAGTAFIGGQPSAVQGAFSDGPMLAEGPGGTFGRIVSALALPDGRVVVGVLSEDVADATGVLHCSPPCRPHLELLDPGTGGFTLTGELPESLGVASMALLRDGRALLVSTSAEGGDLPHATIYDPIADTFDDVGAPVAARDWPLLVTLEDGRVLVAGGNDGEEALATAELFDPATGTFAPTGPMTRGRGIGASATLLDDGRVLVAGGGADVGDSAELFDPATGTFAPTGPMTLARGGFHSATLLDDERVLVVGGLALHPTDPSTIAPEPVASAEIYDPATERFTAVGSMATPRYMQAASLLGDGTVLLVGGSHERPPEGGVVPTTDAEIYDPATGEFRPTGSLDRARLMPAAVTTDDRVLLLGHWDPAAADPLAGASSEWFD